MKALNIVLIIFMVSLPPTYSLQHGYSLNEAFPIDLLNNVSSSNVIQHLKVLTNFRTRYAAKGSCNLSAEYIASCFQSYKLNVSIHRFRFTAYDDDTKIIVYKPRSLIVYGGSMINPFRTFNLHINGSLTYIGFGSKEELKGLNITGKLALMKASENLHNVLNLKPKGAIVIIPDKLPIPPLTWLSQRHFSYENVAFISQPDGEELIKLAMEAPLEVGIAININRRSFTGVNIIAMKAGGNRFNEHVVLCAHYDSISPLVNFAPGANDDASGVASILEAARVLEPLNLNRSIIFAAFSAEELGLIGSSIWVAEHREIIKNTVAAMAIDMVGAGGYQIITTSKGMDLAKFIVKEVSRIGFNVSIRLASYMRTDSESFARAGVKAFHLHEVKEYPYIHTPYDIIEMIDLDNVVNATKIVVAAAYKLSTSLLQQLKNNQQALINELMVHSLSLGMLTLTLVISYIYFKKARKRGAMRA